MPPLGSGPDRGLPPRCRGLAAAIGGILVAAVTGGCDAPPTNLRTESEPAAVKPPTASRAPETTAPVGSSASPSAPLSGVDARRLEAHLHSLARITDEHGGTRAVGTPGYDAAAAYVADALRAAGYDVTAEPFDAGGVPSTNVLAELRGGRELVVVGAHLDSVPVGPGVNDNASGVAALLAVAETLATWPPPHRTVRFAFWGAEEGGPFGSRAHVDAMTADERAAIVAYLNFDMLASPNAVRFVYAEAGAPAGSGEITRRFVDHFESTGLPWAPIDLAGDSDHGPFNAAGIATGGLFTGGIEPVTAEQAAIFDAVAGQPADPCSHAACDTLDNADLSTLEEMAAAILAVLGDLANDAP